MLSCPRCTAGLFVGQTSDVTMHGCGQCGGLWLDSASAVKVRESLPQEALDLAARATKFSSAEVDTRVDALCPVCRRSMRRAQTDAAGVDIDYCSHGTWFDRGELEQIATALRQSRAGSQAKSAQAAPPGYAGGPPPGYAGRSLGSPNVALMGAAVPHLHASPDSSLVVEGVGVVLDIAAYAAADAAADVAIEATVSGVGALAEGAGTLLAEGAGSALVEGAGEAMSAGAGLVVEGIFALIGSIFD